MFRKSQEVLGESHPITLTSINNLASLYCNQGEYGKALPLYKECLRKVLVLLINFYFCAFILLFLFVLYSIKYNEMIHGCSFDPI